MGERSMNRRSGTLFPARYVPISLAISDAIWTRYGTILRPPGSGDSPSWIYVIRARGRSSAPFPGPLNGFGNRTTFSRWPRRRALRGAPDGRETVRFILTSCSGRRFAGAPGGKAAGFLRPTGNLPEPGATLLGGGSSKSCPLASSRRRRRSRSRSTTCCAHRSGRGARHRI